MSNQKKYLFHLFCLSLLLAISIIATGCATKKAVTSDTFAAEMQKAGFIVEDITDQYQTGGYEHLENVQIAISPDGDYQIEFYDCIEGEFAKIMYEQNKTTIENNASGSATKASVESSSFASYERSSQNEYYYIEQVEDTFVYVHTIPDFKTDVKTALKLIGY